MTHDEPVPHDEPFSHADGDPWQPPWWLLVFGPLCWLLVGALLIEHRGWQVALGAAVLLAPIGMPIPAVLRWLKHHPRLAGSYVAPLTFAGTALLTTLPLWLCIAATVATTLLALFLTTMLSFRRS